MGEIKENLDRYYNSIINIADTEWDFFVYISDYVQYIEETEEFVKIVNLLIEDRVKDFQQILKLEGEAVKEINNTALVIIKYVQNDTKALEKIRSSLTELNEFKTGKYRSSASDSDELFSIVREMILSLRDEYNNLVSSFFKESKHIPGNINEYTFSPSYNNLLKEKEILKWKEDYKLWNAWNNLVLVYISIVKWSEEIERLSDKKNNIWNLWNFHSLIGEIRDIRKNNKKSIAHFKRSEYKQYVTRVHNFLQKELSSNRSIKHQSNAKNGEDQDVKKNLNNIQNIFYPNLLLFKNTDGYYYYKQLRIDVSKDIIGYKILDCLYQKHDQEGFTSYEIIDDYLVKQKLPKLKTEAKRNKRIRNAISNSNQGFFRSAKIHGNHFENKVPDGRKLIETISGKGLKLNNPTMNY